MSAGRTGFKWVSWRKPSRLVPVVIVGLIVIGVVGLRLASGSGLNRELAEIRKRGLPTNPRELDAWYTRVPDAENVALKIKKATEHYIAASDEDNPSEIDWRSIPHTEALSPEVMAVLETHVEKNEEALSLLKEAAKLKLSRYPIDLSKAPDLTMSHLMETKTLVDLLRWDAVFRAEKGDPVGAAESILAGFKVSDALAKDPLLVSQLVRFACLSVHLNGMERVVNRARFSTEQLAELMAAARVAAEEGRRAMQRAVIGERAFANTGKTMSFEEYNQVVTLGGMAPGGDATEEFFGKLLFNVRKGIGMDQRDHFYYIRSMGRLEKAMAADHPDFLKQTEGVIAEISTEMNEHPFAYIVSKMSLISIFHAPKNEVMLNARLRCMEMALQIQIFRTANGGRIPQVGELVPGIFREMPKDPFDGTPLEYRILDDGEEGYKITAPAASVEQRKRAFGSAPRDVAVTILK